MLFPFVSRRGKQPDWPVVFFFAFDEKKGPPLCPETIPHTTHDAGLDSKNNYGDPSDGDSAFLFSLSFAPHSDRMYGVCVGKEDGSLSLLLASACHDFLQIHFDSYSYFVDFLFITPRVYADMCWAGLISAAMP